MFSQYFGHYLLNRDLISREQLSDALEYQKQVHVKFGVLAVDKDYMTAAQVEEVHERQKQVDKRFGEIAVELDYLTGIQVETLLSSQKQSYLYLAQALVDRGYFTMDEYSKTLNEYKSEFGLSDEQFNAIKGDSISALVEKVLNSSEANKATIEYISLFVKNMVRFIDDQIRIDASLVSATEQFQWLVMQELTGDAPYYTALGAESDMFLEIASAYAEENLTEVDELAKASVSEFLNLHNGIYSVNMSNVGIILNMKPQEVLEDANISGELLCITVTTSKGNFKLLISERVNTISINSKLEKGAIKS
ncbi:MULTISPECIES: hypothetical protein [Bacillaceae]|uniref:Chemotaxis phosphatase CheX-like domain-containing protein n=1 Tax=Evansella alkalicola TaxID=745819 RepID=A0ABS6JQL1_9BACI|nr:MULTISPECIES: hypothetical protein [Bacillaceae]MBU9720014.1 hypothetical protein [Bacillus alkalicola]